jgi:hypothetical protein
MPLGDREISLRKLWPRKLAGLVSGRKLKEWKTTNTTELE